MVDSLPVMFSAQMAAEQFALSGMKERGAIFTRREVVEFILDLVGYTPDKPLHQFRLLDPPCGQGSFLFPLVERLLAAYRNHAGRSHDAVNALRQAIKAVELHKIT